MKIDSLIIFFLSFFVISPILSQSQTTLSAGPAINAILTDVATLAPGLNAELGIKLPNKNLEFIFRGGYSRYSFARSSSFISYTGDFQVLETVAGLKICSLKKGEVWNEDNKFIYVEGNIGVNHYLLDSVIDILGTPARANGNFSKFRLGGRVGYRWSSRIIGLELFGGAHMTLNDTLVTFESGLNVLIFL